MKIRFASISSCLLLLAFVSRLLAGDASLTPEAQGQALAAELRDRRPGEALSFSGRLERRGPDGKRQSMAVRFETREKGDTWEASYEVPGLGTSPGQRLTVVHRSNQPNEYLLVDIESGEAAKTEKKRGWDGSAMIPFAGSDFWLADLGLDYLHWPAQRIVKTKTSMRKGRACKVLESVNAAGSDSGYTRVLSWIDMESGGPIYAEAYQRGGRLLKVFEVDHVAKVNGVWQLKEMKIRNEQEDSRTSIRFEFDGD